jgi:hypothetical protein
MCQNCAESRCHVCRSGRNSAKKLSIKEQIELFNSLNPNLSSGSPKSEIEE